MARNKQKGVDIINQALFFLHSSIIVCLSLSLCILQLIQVSKDNSCRRTPEKMASSQL